jgi:hypothetical protein
MAFTVEAVFGQTPHLSTSKMNPDPGELVLLEVNVTPDKDTKISWTVEGPGEFASNTDNQSRVQFRPSKAGPVTIVCVISRPGGQDRPSVKLEITGPTTSEPVRPRTTPNEHIPPPQHQSGELLLSQMENMVPSGFMGDAMDVNNGAATLDSGFSGQCRPESVSCIKIEYKPQDGKVGWAAFAWQRVMEGSQNWGESPGADFSHGGFRSLRVFAKGQPDLSGDLPKIQFKSGGNVAPGFYSNNRPTYAVAGPTVPLTPAFKDYCVSLENRDLSNVISPFTVVLTKVSNAKGAIVILDSIRFSSEPCQ